LEVGEVMRIIDADLFKSNVKAWAENIRDIRSDNKCFFTEENILKAIDDQPTVETVNDGEWLSLDTNLIEGYNCSVCGHIFYMTEYGQKIRTKYCSNCGAKMKEQ
jgi:hypothetical protein